MENAEGAALLSTELPSSALDGESPPSIMHGVGVSDGEGAIDGDPAGCCCCCCCCCCDANAAAAADPGLVLVLVVDAVIDLVA